MKHIISSLAVWLLLLGTLVRGQVFDESFDAWPLDLKIQGQILVADELNEQIEKSLTADGRLSSVLVISDACDAQREQLKERWESLANRFALVSSAELIAEQTIADQYAVLFWHCQPCQRDVLDLSFLRLEPVFRSQIAAGKTLLAIGPLYHTLAKFYESDGSEGVNQLLRGMNLLPDTVFISGAFDRDRFANVELADREALMRCVSIELTPGTSLALSGRKMTVAGTGQATFQLSYDASQTSEAKRRRATIQQAERGLRTTKWLLDLTQWRREAIDQTLDAFPPAQPRQPIVERGTLFIVGGGGMPPGLMEQFVEASGGSSAKLVYVPCSEDDEVPAEHSIVASWKKIGVSRAGYIHTKDRQRANADDAFLEPLRDATGIWFGGGRQWNLADSYYGTTAHRLMKEVLHRGGAIGGSSAGASIQARYLARATPIENFDIMAPGYERGGLGFISGVAIDQHFSQRRRQKDMTELVRRYPQLLGIGIDEATALIVKKSTAQVVGRGRVYFYDRPGAGNRDADDNSGANDTNAERRDYLALEAGQAYDLANRIVIGSSEEQAE
ncbi:MAG: cyanophycinase [Pirellulaceae bacterium]